MSSNCNGLKHLTQLCAAFLSEQMQHLQVVSLKCLSKEQIKVGCVACCPEWLPETTAQVLQLTSSDVSAKAASSLCNARQELLELQQLLQQQQECDKQAVPAKIDVLLNQANLVTFDATSQDSPEADKLVYLLQRQAGITKQYSRSLQ